MKRILYLLVLCILASAQIILGQSQETVIKSKPLAADDRGFSGYPNLRLQAEEVVKATVTGDFAKVIDFTHPKIVGLAGGREKMIEFMNSDFVQMKSDGFELISVTVDEAVQIEEIENKLFAVMMTTLKIKDPSGLTESKSSLVGISSDQGSNWTFVNGVGQERFNKMFSAALGRVTIPDEQPAKRIEN